MSRPPLPWEPQPPRRHFPGGRISWVLVLIVVVIDQWTASQAAIELSVLLALALLTLILTTRVPQRG